MYASILRVTSVRDIFLLAGSPMNSASCGVISQMSRLLFIMME
jgi:hypothetical protein